jgi:membrane protease YdiL (CAAX protease family)
VHFQGACLSRRSDLSIQKEIGLWGDWTSYGWALAYPLLVLGLAAAIAAIFGAIDSSEADWNKTLFNIGIMSSTGVLMVMITEEGFFRGWLWASLQRSGKSDRQVLIWTTLAFVTWHLLSSGAGHRLRHPCKRNPYLLDKRHYSWAGLGRFANGFGFGSGPGSQPRCLERH